MKQQVLPIARTEAYHEFFGRFMRDAELRCKIQVHSFTDYSGISFYFLDPEGKPERKLCSISFRTLFYRTYGYVPMIPQN